MCVSCVFLCSQVTEYQTEYRLREFIGRYIAENVNERVTWYSAAQALIILIVVCGQVITLKLFFTEYAGSTVEIT